MVYSDFETYIMIDEETIPCCVTFEYIEADHEYGGMCEEVNVLSIVINSLIDGSQVELTKWFPADSFEDIEGVKSRCIAYRDSL